jgi:transposase
VVGVDAHKRTLTASVVDPRGGIVGSDHFRVSGDGHRALEAWARQFGPIVRWGIEGASAWGRHTAVFLAGRGYDVRDVCPPRGRTVRASAASPTRSTPERIARETLAHPLLPKAFKRVGEDAGPDEQTELLAVWWNVRRSLIKRRQHLLTEAEALLRELPLGLIERLPTCKRVRPRLAALAGVSRRRRLDPPAALRVRILATVSVAELLVEVGDVHRFTIGGFGRFNGTAPLAASTAEGPGEPVRHRYNPGGNRRVNAILHRMAVTQLRCEPRAKQLYANARANGHTKKEARRILKRHLSDVVYRRMILDAARLLAADPPLLAA